MGIKIKSVCVCVWCGGVRDLCQEAEGGGWYQTEADNSNDWCEGGREQDKRTTREKTNKLNKDPDGREGERTIFIESLLCTGGFLYKTEMGQRKGKRKLKENKAPRRRPQ